MSARPNAYHVYLAMGLASAIFLQMIYTPLAVYYVQTLQLDPLQLVLIGTVLEVTEIVFELPTGVVADTFGRRRSVIIGEILIGLGFISQGLVPLFGAILVAEAIRGIGGTFISGALDAWIADELEEERIRNAYLRYGQVRLVGGVVGLGIGVVLGTFHLALPIVLGGVLMVVLGLVLTVAMPETGFRPTTSGQWAGWHATWGPMVTTSSAAIRLARGASVLPMLLTATVALAVSGEGLDRLGEAHFIREIGFPAAIRLDLIVWFGIINLGASLLGLLAAEVVIRRVDSSTPARAAGALFAINALALAAIVTFGLAGNFWLALVAYWSVGLLGSLTGPIQGAWLNQNIDPSVRATTLSIVGQANALGQLAGGPAIGAVGTRFGLRAAMVFAGLALSPALVLYGRARRNTRLIKPRRDSASGS